MEHRGKAISKKCHTLQKNKRITDKPTIATRKKTFPKIVGEKFQTRHETSNTIETETKSETVAKTKTTSVNYKK